MSALIDDDDTHLVEYSYLGLGTAVEVNYPEPNVKLTLADLTETNDPDTGDIYSGLDRFGRVKDHRWHNATEEEDVVRLQYGYDRASNRLWKEDVVATALSQEFDELYSYDGVHRLKDMQRGLLNGGQTAITSPTFAQCWSLDATNNWSAFKEAATGGSWTLNQSREANLANEITDITNSVGGTWATPAHNRVGNMTTIPKPADPTKSFTATYDAWNRLMKLEEQLLTPLPILVKVSENQYDARGFRTLRKDYTLGILSTTRHFYYTAGWQVVEERLESATAPDRQFVWGLRYIDDLAVRDSSSGSSPSTLDTRLFCLQDPQFNVVAVIAADATVEERYTYTPFGKPVILNPSMTTIRTTSDVDIEVLFTGQRFDGHTKLHLFRMRWFDSVTGRFVTRDPLGYPNGMNSYAGWFVPSDLDSTGQVGGAGIGGPQWPGMPGPTGTPSPTGMPRITFRQITGYSNNLLLSRREWASTPCDSPVLSDIVGALFYATDAGACSASN